MQITRRHVACLLKIVIYTVIRGVAIVSKVRLLIDRLSVKFSYDMTMFYRNCDVHKVNFSEKFRILI